MMNNDEIREDFLTWSGGFPPESEAQILIYIEAAMPIAADPVVVGAFLREWMAAPDTRPRMDTIYFTVGVCWMSRSDLVPAIGLDLDGTIDEAPEFFRILSQVWPGKVYVITYRADRAKAERDVAKFDIRCEEIVLVSSFAQKTIEIAERNIKVYVDDQDEMLLHIPEGVTILKIRNGGNFDFDLKKWLFSDQTGRML